RLHYAAAARGHPGEGGGACRGPLQYAARRNARAPRRTQGGTGPLVRQQWHRAGDRPAAVDGRGRRITVLSWASCEGGAAFESDDEFDRAAGGSRCAAARGRARAVRGRRVRTATP